MSCVCRGSSRRTRARSASRGELRAAGQTPVIALGDGEAVGGDVDELALAAS